MNLATLGYYVGIPFSNPFIRFYAICILLGALLALYLANYRAHQDGFDMHFFDSVFPGAFLSGIIGARIWYVIATYQQEFAGKGFLNMLDIRSGGLAIQGGAIGGILVGALICIFRRKGTSILRIADYAVPTILLAQAIGRWGNFFNQEVFGHFVSTDAWSFLPKFITNNMQNGDLPMGAYIFNGKVISSASTGIYVPEGGMASPLFLVEGIVNVMFYFLIAHGLPSVLGKKYRIGDQTFSYFIAYGITRAVLEPLRNTQFIMGTDSSLEKSHYKSFIMAIIFIVMGVILIVLNHVFHYLARKGKFDSLPGFKSVFIEESVVEENKILANNLNSTVETKQDDSYSFNLEKLRAKEKEMEEDKKDEGQ